MPEKTSGLAIAALILSVLFFIPLCAPIGVILGIVALVKLNKTKEKGKGLAIAAIIIGSLVTIVQIIILIMIFAVVGMFVGGLAIGDINQSMQNCMASEGLAKDTCIIMGISVNANQTAALPPDFCDQNLQMEDFKSLCNAIVKRDKSYCQKILDAESQRKCVEMVDDLVNKY
jgi:hypothetical protein